MTSRASVLLLSLALAPLPLLAFSSEPAPRRSRVDLPRETPAAIAPTPRATASLPPLPDGVTELPFSDLFKTPVGPRGLELTDRVQALDGQRVRVSGHMVREHVDDGHGHHDVAPAVPGRFLLTPLPQRVHFAHYGLSEDLPPQTLYVTLSEKIDRPVPYTPQPLLLTGVLHVGLKTEPDGRTSVLRLTLDPLPPSSVPTGSESSHEGHDHSH